MLPRPIFRGDLYLVTRRTAGRHFYLKPSRKLNRTIEYIIAVVAKRTGVKIHALCVLSNHYHCVASDPLANMPAFLRDVHSQIAKHVNHALGRWENVWSSEQTSLVRSEADEDVLERIVYTMANPTLSKLVAYGKSWPGLRLCWPQKRRPVRRPKGFYREDGPMPKYAALELARPPGFEEYGDTELACEIAFAIAAREERKRREVHAAGEKFLGRKAILAQSPFDCPSTPAPHGNLSPTVGVKNKWRRIEVLQRLAAWISDYRKAYAEWRAGDTTARFPAGTYKLRIEAGVHCAPSGSRAPS